MNLCDVVFPQNLTTLTYQVPESLLPDLKKGQIVLAPLRGKIKKGLLIRHYCAEKLPRKDLKKIESIAEPEPLYSEHMLSLLEWAADYYITNTGTMLKSMLFKEITKKPRNVAEVNVATEPPSVRIPEDAREILQEISNERGFRSYLYHAADGEHEIGFVGEMIKEFQKAIVLVPEVEETEAVFSYLRKVLGKRVCMYHSDLKRSERYDALMGVYRGKYDVVVGTRPIVFAPMTNPSIIIVMREHNYAYKQEESPRYHARDVAVMKAYIEGIPVLLTSVTPSVESYSNCLKRKYTLLRSKVKIKHPRLFVLDMKKQKRSALYMANKLVESLKRLSPEDSVVAIIQRLGYSMLKCQDCDTLVLCPKCEKPLVLHRASGESSARVMLMCCHSCGHKESPPDACPRCGGYNLQYYGAGTERIEEELKRYLNREVIRIDSTSGKEEKIDSASDGKVIVGTLKVKSLLRRSLDLVAFLNPDIVLNQPEVKAVERFIQDVFYVRDLVKNDGTVYLQTEIPWHPVYRYLRRWDYEGFLREEIKNRKRHKLPPFSKMINLRIHLKRGMSEVDFDELTAKIENTEFIGPVNPHFDSEGYMTYFEILLKDEDVHKLRKAVEHIREFADRQKMLLKCDVDPVFF